MTADRATPAGAVRPPRIAVCGAGEADDVLENLAHDVGARLARAGAVLVCGGLGGVMEAAARGAHGAGGLTIGVLPGRDASLANPFIALPLPTGMGEARNVLVVRFADAIIAIGGEWGTLSEIALARRIGRPLVLLAPTLAAALGLETAADAGAAVRRALALAGALRA
jgi:uncharacterized protein (TIGR00725 family)